MELRGHKQATAHSHEHTKNSNPSKNFSRRQNSNSNLLINSQNSRNRSNLFQAWYQQKYAFTEDGCKCPFSLTTAESSAVAPTLSRVNSHIFTLKALLHCATPLKSNKWRRVNRNSTSLYGKHRGARHIGRQTKWQTLTNTFDGRNKLDPSMSVDVAIPDCSSKAAQGKEFRRIFHFGFCPGR